MIRAVRGAGKNWRVEDQGASDEGDLSLSPTWPVKVTRVMESDSPREK